MYNFTFIKFVKILKFYIKLSIQEEKMNLTDRLAQDMKEAMKAGEKNRLRVLRSVLADLRNAGIEKGGGEAGGDSMYEGTIYVGGSYGSLGNDAKVEEITEDELISVWDYLDQNGISEKPRFTNIVSAKRLYHYD